MHAKHILRSNDNLVNDQHYSSFYQRSIKTHKHWSVYYLDLICITSQLNLNTEKQSWQSTTLWNEINACILDGHANSICQFSSGFYNMASFQEGLSQQHILNGCRERISKLRISYHSNKAIPILLSSPIYNTTVLPVRDTYSEIGWLGLSMRTSAAAVEPLVVGPSTFMILHFQKFLVPVSGLLIRLLNTVAQK